ncbi:uncharacterized protein [Prorops nasuta]|uniref:uncharacterized protein n=1 Tax=Prorops nasuta TaxID=863751 RepID=UPI0034CD1360
MATNGEESDSDDIIQSYMHTLPKRHCIRIPNTDDNQETGTQSNEQRQIEEDEAEDTDRNESLKLWEVKQMAKGFMDNTINKVLENYIMQPSRLFRDNDMENTAVMMAIQNHGLVHSTGDSLFLTSHAYDSSYEQSEANFSTFNPVSVEPFEVDNSAVVEKCNESDTSLEDTDDSDQQEDFLERAVAEAIKKKGLIISNILK